MSFELKPATKKSLAKFAKSRGRSSNVLVSDVVESFVADQKRMLAEVRVADREVASGHYIRHQDMKAWLLSWGKETELPPPKCACGKDHSEKSR
jgi:predicted transcriptional regulator